MAKEEYWHIYYDSETIARSNALRQEYYLEMGDITLHLDAYQRSDPASPVVLFTHGEGSYGRMLVNVALALHDRGYTVLVLDQRGHGFSSGRDFTLAHLAQDVLDAAHWARRTFSGPLFLGGANQGGALAYQASALGAPVVGLLLHQLYQFGDPQEVMESSRLAQVAGLPGGATVTSAALRTLAAVSPGLRLPLQSLARSRAILDDRDNGRYEAWLKDPFVSREVSVRFALSTLTMPPALPYEQNALPVLVINPTRDRMVEPGVTRRSFARLGGPKSYAEIDYGHWSMTREFAARWADIVDQWIGSLMLRQ